MELSWEFLTVRELVDMMGKGLVDMMAKTNVFRLVEMMAARLELATVTKRDHQMDSTKVFVLV